MVYKKNPLKHYIKKVLGFENQEMLARYNAALKKINPETLKQNQEALEEIIGFGNVLEKGKKLNLNEINHIVSYCSLFKANETRIQDILLNSGRPFSIYDPFFESKCLLCNSLRNYCSC
ncbi:MAG: hypothetical protein ACP5OG_02400 [Candidatus Nanoarchaeia archaeon]